MELHDLLLPEVTSCQRCPRLVDYLNTLPPKGGRCRADYWNRPVPGFGDLDARIWLVGLAPGAHGANRTGRPFTGDGAGDFMYPLLYQAGLSTQEQSESWDDALRLHGLYISNAVKCVPPGNKPLASEFHACRDYLYREWQQLTSARVILALGRDAFISILHLLKEQGMVKRLADFPFAHDACFELPNGQYLLSCYHTSRYNVQTGRMTEELFLRVLKRARRLAEL